MPGGAVDDATGRPDPLRRTVPALLLGTTCVVAGGLVAAVTAAAPLTHGAWVAAYLVLVAGVAQVGLALGQAVLSLRPPSCRALAVECVTWNLGNLAVVVGTLVGIAALVDLGGVLLVAALAGVGIALRGASRGVGRPRRFVLHGVQALVLVLLVSIPIGLWLAHARG